jgi:surface protein
MAYMFCGCEAVSSLDISVFDTVNVTDMSYTFFGCKSLPQIDVCGFSTQGV